jgi:hypothetical protein
MARAGVAAVFVGQESGDQRILKAMKKGTHTRQIKPAVAALGRSGISAHFSFIHGFPGEDHASLANTRNVILSLNEGFEDRPVVLLAHVGPMQYYDFSSAGQRSSHGGSGWGTRLFGEAMRNPVAPHGWGFATLETWLQMSRVPHAPMSSLYSVTDPADTLHMELYTHPRRHEIFRWGKAVQRGVAIFLEREWEGTPPDDAELRRVIQQIRAELPRRTIAQAVQVRTVGELRRRIIRQLVREVKREPERGPGLVTRALSAVRALNDTARLGSAVEAWRTTLTGPVGTVPESEPPIVEALAKDLIRDSVSSSLAWREARRLRTVSS